MLQTPDSDGLNDGIEIENWFDPLEDDYDKDGRDGLLEYQEGTSPYAYDKSWDEHLADFRDGFFGGEFIEDTDSIPCMLGKNISGFTPVGNVRDMVADIIQGDWIDAGVNFAGILIDAADAAKTSGKIGKFLLNNADNSALYAEILSFVNKNFPDALKYLGKDENFVKATKKISLKKEDKITKKQHDELKEIFDKMGLDDLIDGGSESGSSSYYFRGTTKGYAGNSSLQRLEITPASTDPLVSTVFATNGEQYGEGVLYICSADDLKGVSIAYSNVLSSYAKEVCFDMLPLEFADRASISISASDARAILRDMGYEIPSKITREDISPFLSNSPKLSDDEIMSFVVKARGVQ